MKIITQQPYKGRWELSRDGMSIGAVNGDCVIGFTARDAHGNTLGRYVTSEDAMDAVVFVAERAWLEATWAQS